MRNASQKFKIRNYRMCYVCRCTYGRVHKHPQIITKPSRNRRGTTSIRCVRLCVALASCFLLNSTKYDSLAISHVTRPKRTHTNNDIYICIQSDSNTHTHTLHYLHQPPFTLQTADTKSEHQTIKANESSFPFGL